MGEAVEDADDEGAPAEDLISHYISRCFFVDLGEVVWEVQWVGGSGVEGLEGLTFTPWRPLPVSLESDRWGENTGGHNALARRTSRGSMESWERCGS